MFVSCPIIVSAGARVTFGALSSLEQIGVCCFQGSGLEEVIIPDSIRELCDDCFDDAQVSIV